MEKHKCSLCTLGRTKAPTRRTRAWKDVIAASSFIANAVSFADEGDTSYICTLNELEVETLIKFFLDTDAELEEHSIATLSSYYNHCDKYGIDCRRVIDAIFKVYNVRWFSSSTTDLLDKVITLFPPHIVARLITSQDSSDYSLGYIEQNIPDSVYFNQLLVSMKIETRRLINIHVLEHHELATLKVFQKRLGMATHGRLENMNWWNVCVAGGSVVHGLCRDLEVLPSSDTDLWVYGPKPENTVKRLVNFLSLKGPCLITLNRSVINICYTDIPVRLQVITIDVSSILEVVNTFDLPYCKAAFDGERVFVTKEARESLLSRSVVIPYCTDATHIIISKAMAKGFDVTTIHSIHHQLIEDARNAGPEWRTKFYFPHSKKKDEREMLRKIFGGTVHGSYRSFVKDYTYYSFKSWENYELVTVDSMPRFPEITEMRRPYIRLHDDWIIHRPRFNLRLELKNINVVDECLYLGYLTNSFKQYLDYMGSAVTNKSFVPGEIDGYNFDNSVLISDYGGIVRNPSIYFYIDDGLYDLVLHPVVVIKNDGRW